MNFYNLFTPSPTQNGNYGQQLSNKPSRGSYLDLDIFFLIQIIFKFDP